MTLSSQNTANLVPHSILTFIRLLELPRTQGENYINVVLTGDPRRLGNL